MTIRTVQIDSSSFIPSDDCVVLRNIGNHNEFVEIAFPFHEDTPNFRLTIPQAMDMRNAIDELIKVNFIEAPKGEI